MAGILLIDGNHLAWRHFMQHEYEQGQLTTSTGLPTTVLYGCLESAIKIEKDLPGDYALVAFIWDKGSSWRRQINTEYKHDRHKKLPEGTRNRVEQQIGVAQHALADLKVPQFSVSGLEGDDCLGLLSHYLAQNPDNYVVLVSSDKDLFQLLGGRVAVYNAQKGEYHTAESFTAKHKIEPQQWTSLKAMAGKAGEVPGVKGIGPAGAVKVLKLCGDIRNLTDEHIKQLGKREAKALEAVTKEDLARYWLLSYILRNPTTEELGQYYEPFIQETEQFLEALNDRVISAHTLNNFFAQYEMVGMAKRQTAVCNALKIQVAS